MTNKETAIATTQKTGLQHASQRLMRPVASPVELIEAHKEAAELIRDALQDGRDFGAIPGAGQKKVLLKPGAERLIVAFGLRPEFSIIEQEIDHDRVNKFVDRFKKESTSLGLYRFVVKCQLFLGEELRGEGIGSCSTLETKYISRPRDCENTALKMSKKRALVDAVCSTLSLSDRFTQDVNDEDEDLSDHEPPRQAPRKEPEKTAVDPELAIVRAKIGQALTELGYVEDFERVNKVRMEAGLGGEVPKSLDQMKAVLTKLQAEIEADKKPLEGEVIE